MIKMGLIFWKDRLRASGIHLVISLGIALLAALLVFALWYPYPYREISGGRELFLIVVVVDVMLGPLITLAVFNRAKPKAELRRDLALVGLIQLAALGYGLWTVFVARPVHLVFEYDRFRVVHAVDIPPELMQQNRSGVEALPLNGPSLLALRPFRDSNEQMEATLSALQGVSLSARPHLWQLYSQAKPQVLQVAKPALTLMERFPTDASLINDAVAQTRLPIEALVYLPLISRQAAWTVLLDPVTAEPLAYLPLDSF
jgi:hypothetical protein